VTAPELEVSLGSRLKFAVELIGRVGCRSGNADLGVEEPGLTWLKKVDGLRAVRSATHST
jgi:hypothetical protein